jgi:tetratricopeptide (TPR) repeat protein
VKQTETDTDIRDIYRAPKDPLEPPHVWRLAEEMAREIRNRRIFNISAMSLTLFLLLFLTFVSIQNYLSFLPEKVELPPPPPPSYVAGNALPEDERWVLDYRQVATLADTTETPGPKDLSARWIKNAAYHIIMGEEALRLDNLKGAQSHLEKVVEFFPEMKDVRRALGKSYLGQQRFEAAAEVLTKELEQNPSFDVLVNLGLACIGTEEYDRAETLLKQALAQRPGFAGCHKNLALLYQKTGDTNAAITHFEAYFAVHPEDTGLIHIYAGYLTGIGRPADAVAFLDRIQTVDSLPVFLLLAKTAAQAGNEAAAVRALIKASRYLSPRMTLVEMNDAAFAKIKGGAEFEEFTRQLELAAVSSSTNGIHVYMN